VWRFASRHRATQWELTVSDTGQIISRISASMSLNSSDKPKRSHSHAHKSGLGLGLFIDLVRLHDGTIEVEVRQGTTSQVRLPFDFE